MIILGFAGFLRYSEIADIKRHDVIFCPTYTKIFIEKSKTDIYRDGHWLYLAKLNSPLCPTKMLKLWFKKASISNDLSEEYIFRAITVFKKKNVSKLRKSNEPISYSTMREHVLKAVKDIGLDESKFGLHSLRSGGATAAANNGVEDRLFKRHGRWKSESVKNGYVKDNIHRLLSVSLRLGI